MDDLFDIDLDSVTREELEDALERVYAAIGELDVEEPEDMMSEEYDSWGDRREELEDLADDITDLLEEL